MEYSATWMFADGDLEVDMFPAETTPTDRAELSAQFDALCRAFDEHLARGEFPEGSPTDAPAARWRHGECLIDLETRWSQPVIGVLQLHVSRASA